MTGLLSLLLETLLCYFPVSDPYLGSFHTEIFIFLPKILLESEVLAQIPACMARHPVMLTLVMSYKSSLTQRLTSPAKSHPQPSLCLTETSCSCYDPTGFVSNQVQRPTLLSTAPPSTSHLFLYVEGSQVGGTYDRGPVLLRMSTTGVSRLALSQEFSFL